MNLLSNAVMEIAQLNIQDLVEAAPQVYETSQAY
jgi:hypothetical protein